jgi:hypothetical protein
MPKTGELPPRPRTSSSITADEASRLTDQAEFSDQEFLVLVGMVHRKIRLAARERKACVIVRVPPLLARHVSVDLQSRGFGVCAINRVHNVDDGFIEVSWSSTASPPRPGKEPLPAPPPRVREHVGFWEHWWLCRSIPLLRV